MAYNEKLTKRIRELLIAMPGLVEKKMFGGVGFMLHGNMACGVHKDMLVVRVGADMHNKAMGKPHTHAFEITGRPMSGWVLVDAAGFEGDEDLKEWVELGVNFALTLPPK